jgi:succinoglycan biosynthesis transport protein ExoP
MTLAHYLDILWRRKWLVMLVVAVATGSAYFFSALQTPMYEAEATVVYKQQLDLANPLNTTHSTNWNLDREIASIDGLLEGSDLREGMNALLRKDGSADLAIPYEVSAAPAESETSTVSNNVAVFTGSSPSAAMAAAAANAAAQAYVNWNAELQRRQIALALPVIREQLRRYETDESKLSADYLMLKQRLQDLQILKATATGNYHMLASAAKPDAPASPRPLRNAILGLGIGLFAGIGLAFVLEQLDTRLRTSDQVAALMGQPILGHIPKMSGKDREGRLPVTLTQPDGQVAEAFRMVRTNLDFMAVDNDVKSIAVTSCLQGEGKSTSLANLAVTMALSGKKVVVVDADLRRPQQHKLFDVPNGAGLSTVIAERTLLTEALAPVDLRLPEAGATSDDFAAWSRGSEALLRLYVLPSGPLPPNPGELVASRRFASIIQQLEELADIVLVDTPAMLAVGDASAIAPSIDGFVFLVDMQTARRPQLITAAAQLSRLPTALLGLVMRVYGTSGSRYGYQPYYYAGSLYAEDDGRKKKKRDQVPAPTPGGA